MDTSHDPRSQYLGNVAAYTLGHGELAGQIAAAPEIARYLNELNHTALQIRADVTAGGQVALRYHLDRVAEPPAGGQEVHFVKLDKNVPIEMSNIQAAVLVSSIKQNAINTLYVLINKIYLPLLRQGDDTEADAGDGPQKSQEGHALRDPLYALRAGLRRTIRKGGTNLKKFDFDPNQFRGVLEPLDEIGTWQDLENADKDEVTKENEKLRTTAEIISRHFQPLQKPFEDLPQAPLGSIVRYIDTIEDSLGNIWTDPDILPVYPAARMANTFRVISRAFGSRIEREFKESDVWQASFSDVRRKLNECMGICSKWRETMTHLTKISWKQKSKGGQDHQWKDAPYVDHYLQNIIGRMAEIFELRSQHDELLRLLTSEERDEMKVEGFFAPFRKINSFYTNEMLADTWKNARRQYERMLEPAEKAICQKLRKEVFTEQASTPTQRMREVQRWKGLMSKPSIQKECAQERENLVTEMIAEVKKMGDDFAARAGRGIKSIPGMEKPPQCQNVSPVISAIIWAR
jgi:dynein heavy chain 2